LASVAAFKPGQCALEDWQASVAQVVCHTLEAIALTKGKLVAQGQLRIAQNVDDVMR
jgi:hypothetical protein